MYVFILTSLKVSVIELIIPHEKSHSSNWRNLPKMVLIEGELLSVRIASATVICGALSFEIRLFKLGNKMEICNC